MSENIINSEILSKKINLEIGEAISKALPAVLSAYGDSPLRKITLSVFDKHEDIIRESIDKIVFNMFKSKEFNNILKEEFNRKVAKSLVGTLSGLVEKSSNKFRNDPVIKSKMILSLQNIIENK